LAQILFVCHGNLCRSPFAERILRASLDRVPSKRPTVGSAGLHPALGAQIPSPFATILTQLGADAENHTPRQLHAPSVAEATLILTATRALRSEVVGLHSPAVQYTYTIRQVENLLRRQAAIGLFFSLPPGSPEDRLAAIVEQLRTHHGGPRRSPADDDVVDPYLQPTKTYVKAARQMLPSLDLLAQGLGAPISERPQELVTNTNRRLVRRHERPLRRLARRASS
jgi:protein-tyrosine phosphatase